MKTLKTLALCVVLLVLPQPSFAQGDEFPFSRSIMVNSPAVITSWPITSQITGVHFEMVGWRVDFDRRRGPNAWPNVTTPGWDGPLQYTLGLCRHMTPSWVCSAVVEFWQSRLEDEGVRAGAPPGEIAKEWFYDSRWGALAGWQPALGEQVGVFIMAGDGRNTTTVFPGTVPQRTAARLLTWGTDIGAVVMHPEEPKPEEPKPEDPKPKPEEPTQPPTGVPWADREQLERIYADLVKRDEAHAAQLAALSVQVADIATKQSQIAAIFSNRYVQLAIAAAGTYFTTHQMTKP